jgi:hypothetical protein
MLLNTITKRMSLKIPLLLIGLSALPSITMASDNTSSIKSISYASDAVIDTSSKDALLQQAETSVITSILKEGSRTESGSAEKLTLTTSYLNSGNFNIYNVNTDLISDFDYDGFYHRFSITIDADTNDTDANVYAKIYLSYEGGPWNYMASSDIYTIHSDSSLDAFTIETELTDGFYAGYYDVRIELYDADYNEWLFSYGPYDDSSISALPLEDSYNDNFYDSYSELSYTATREVFVSGHGSMGGWLLFALSLILVARKLSTKPLDFVKA